MKTISVGKLSYDTSSGAGMINITDASGGNPTLNIDFETILGTLFKLTTSGRGKLTSRFAGEDFQFVCIQAVQKMSLFFPFTSNGLPVIMVTNL
jgi:hypothetical protein